MEDLSIRAGVVRVHSFLVLTTFAEAERRIMKQKAQFIGWFTIVALLIAPMQALACQIGIWDYNQHRRITGVVDVECPGDHPGPWGNWGVDSNHGSRYDGNQFRGWFDVGDGTREWNSCTFTNPEWRAPNCVYYNYDNCTTQYNYPIDQPAMELYATFTSDVQPWPCSENGMIVTLRSYFMHLWELDPICCDDDVALVNYPDINITLSEEPGGGRYSGWSNPIDPNSITGNFPSFGTAQIRVFYEMWETP